MFWKEHKTHGKLIYLVQSDVGILYCLQMSKCLCYNEPNNLYIPKVLKFMAEPS